MATSSTPDALAGLPPLTPDEQSMLDGGAVEAFVDPRGFVRVSVRRKLELRGTTLVLGHSVVKQLAASLLLMEAHAAQAQMNGGAIVPANGLPPTPPSGQRS